MRTVFLGLCVIASGCGTISKPGPATNAASPAAPPILSRAEWQARAPVGEMKAHTPSRITVHHTATLQKPERSLADKLRALQNFSQSESQLAGGKTKPVWPDIPYHYYIDCHGAIGEGRDVNYAGDTNTEYDPTGHALVVLEGNFEVERVAEAQWASLVQLTTWLAARFQVRSDNIQGHQDYTPTLCPGKRLQERLPELRKGQLRGR